MPLGIPILLVHYSFIAIRDDLLVYFTNSREDYYIRGSILVFEGVKDLLNGSVVLGRRERSG